ncbi:MAG: efflux RND transporter permease subunit [Planctomycetota bacterium]
MKIAAFGVQKPVVANLVMLAILGAGLVFGSNLRREFFPEVRPTQVAISAPYPGASPAEVEDALAIKIEDALIDIAEIDEITTVVRESFATVTAEYTDGVNIDAAVAEVKRRIDALQDLPDGADRITVEDIEPQLPAIVVTIFGDADEREIKRAAQDIRDDLNTLGSVGELRLSGPRNDEVTVEVRPAALLEHGVSLADVAGRIRAAMLELPGGTVRTDTANYGIRAAGVDERAGAVREIVVKGDPGGTVVRVEDIADIRDGFADTPLESRFNGKRAASITVFSGGEEDLVAIAAIAKAYVAGRNGEAFDPTFTERLAGIFRPPSSDAPRSKREEAWELGFSKADLSLPGELVTTTDLARFVVGRLDLLTRNAFWGGVLVFATLVVLLNWRVSFWVAAGLVVSLSGTLAVMYFVGETLNLLSMFGLIVVIGVLVDDAIVVAENITSHHEAGEPALASAVSGTRQVGWPVVATVLTTVCAFLPLALLEGTIGDYVGVLPVVVACALLVSLAESLFILPSHMAHSLKHADEREGAKKTSLFSRVERRLDTAREAFFDRFVIRWYVALLKVALKRRYTTLLIALAILVGSLGIVAGGRLEFILFEADDAESLTVELRMPVGTPLAATAAVVEQIEAAVEAQSEVTSYFTSLGSISPVDGLGGATVSTDAAQVIVELGAIETRDRSSEQVIESIRDAIGVQPGVRSLRIEEQSGGPGGAALSFTLVGEDTEELERAADDLMDAMSRFDGVVDIATNIERGQRELRVELRDGATELGFTRENLGRQVQGFAFGIEAFTFAGNREDVDVRVLLPESERRSIAAIERQYVFTPAGDPVPLAEVARLVESRAEATINRLDRQRSLTITADVDRRRANPETVSAELAPRVEELLSAYPGVGSKISGRQKDAQDSFSTLPLGMLVAAGLIYVVLAWLFASYFQPLVVMAAIPFAAIGMIWGHMAVGMLTIGKFYTLTFLSLIGFVALAGVVVNDSLIFMQFFNGRRKAGDSVRDAALAAGKARVRAIVLTTVTTVLGLLPLMLEQSFQARFLIPMAITIACGLISATGVILIVLPSLLVILSDAKMTLQTLWSGERVTDDAYVDPASELEDAIRRSPTGGQRT